MLKSQTKPTECRFRAAVLRSVAESTINPAHRVVLMNCAEDYERMANQVDLVQSMYADVKGQRPN